MNKWKIELDWKAPSGNNHHQVVVAHECVASPSMQELYIYAQINGANIRVGTIVYKHKIVSVSQLKKSGSV